MANSPKAKSKPQVSFIVYRGDRGDAESLSGDIGSSLIKLEMQAMANGGYTIRGTFSDSNFNIYDKLIEADYFLRARKEPMKIQFQCRWDGRGQAPVPQSATKKITAFLISMEALQPKNTDRNDIEFVAIDPPSWYLNAGDASGKCFTGNVGSVMRQVIEEYTPPDRLQLDIATTTDSKEGKWWLMRQDPKSFLSSMFDWSSAVTESKTQWVFAPNNYKLTIKPQGLLPSKQRRYYTYQKLNHDQINSFRLLTDNALSAVQTKLITQGLSTISGQYLDFQTAKKEVQVFDGNTDQKKVARVKQGRSFSKPPEGSPPSVGYTSIMSVPEIGSAGDLGLPYKDYIDGRPRAMYLNMVNNLMKAKVSVLGDGEWSSCEGLGVDTIFVDWVKAAKNGNKSKLQHWYTGSWLVYGFYHNITPTNWTTDVYCARFDQDSTAIKVGGN